MECLVPIPQPPSAISLQPAAVPVLDVRAGTTAECRERYAGHFLGLRVTESDGRPSSFKRRRDLGTLYYPLSYLGLRLAESVAGDAPKPKKAWQDFFALWKDADKDIPALIESPQGIRRTTVTLRAIPRECCVKSHWYRFMMPAPIIEFHP